MAARHTTKKLYQLYPSLKQGVKNVQRDVFGYAPNLNIRTGQQVVKKALTGVYLNRYYSEPIDKSARKVSKGITYWNMENQYVFGMVVNYYYCVYQEQYPEAFFCYFLLRFFRVS